MYKVNSSLFAGWKVALASTILICFSFGSIAQDLPGKGQTVRPIKAPPDNTWFQHLIVQAGLERLGYTVEEHKLLEFSVLHLAIANGEGDYTANHWQPLHNGFFEKSGGDAKMARVGRLIVNAKQGYLIDKKTADKYSLTKIDQLKSPEIAKLFDSDGDGKANLAGCEPGWACQKIVDHHIGAYGLRNAVTQDQGSYVAVIANTIARYKEGKPVVYYSWTPMWVSNVLVPGKDVVWIDVPFSSAPGDARIDTATPDGRNTGFAVNDMRIVANNQFLSQNPAAKRLFEMVSIPLDDINKQNNAMYAGEKSLNDVKRHAATWISANKTLFDGWVSEAIKVGKR